MSRPVNGMRAVHPGEVLREDFLVPLGLSVNALALALGVPATRIHEIVKERRSITADTAQRLAQYFGGDAASWLMMQADYDLKTLPNRTEIVQRVHRCNLVAVAACVCGFATLKPRTPERDSAVVLATVTEQAVVARHVCLHSGYVQICRIPAATWLLGELGPVVRQTGHGVGVADRANAAAAGVVGAVSPV